MVRASLNRSARSLKVPFIIVSTIVTFSRHSSADVLQILYVCNYVYCVIYIVYTNICKLYCIGSVRKSRPLTKSVTKPLLQNVCHLIT